jgi:hypothetical protein
MKKSVIVICDVHCEWTGNSPVYRLYVDNELFAERLFRWEGFYLEEVIPVAADSGSYTIRYELLPHENARLDVRNPRIQTTNCNATMDNMTIRIP